MRSRQRSIVTAPVGVLAQRRTATTVAVMPATMKMRLSRRKSETPSVMRVSSGSCMSIES